MEIFGNWILILGIAVATAIILSTSLLVTFLVTGRQAWVFRMPVVAGAALASLVAAYYMVLEIHAKELLKAFRTSPATIYCKNTPLSAGYRPILKEGRLEGFLSLSGGLTFRSEECKVQ